MIRRTIGVLAYGLATFATVSTMALGYLVIELRNGELPLSGLERPLRDFVAHRVGDLSVSFGTLTARMAPATGELELVVSDLSVRGGDGALLVEAPRAAIDPDIRGSLLAGALKLRAISIIEPTLEARRDAEGRYDFAILGAALPRSLANADGHLSVDDLGDLASAILSVGGESMGPRQFRIEGAKVRLLDLPTGSELEGVDGRLSIDRVRGAASLGVRFPLAHGDTWITAALRSGKTADVTEVDTTFSGLELVELAPWIELPPVARGLDLRVSGTVSGELGGARDGLFHLQASASGGSITTPEPLALSMAVDQLQVDTELNVRAMRAKVDKLILQSGDMRLEGEGEIGLASSSVELRYSGIDVARLKSSWPVSRAPNARRWVEANLQEGRIENGRAGLRFDDNGAEVEGKFRFERTALSYVSGMPSAVELEGEARFDPAGIEFALQRGRSGGLELVGGKVALGRPVGSGPATGKIELDLRGTVPAALELARRVPSRRLEQQLSALGRVHGDGRYRLQLDLPLVATLGAEDVRLGLEAELTDVAAPSLLDGRALTRGSISLKVDPREVLLSGRVHVDAVPIDRFELVLPLAATAESRFELEAQATVTPEQLVALGSPALDGVTGRIGVVVRATSPSKGPLTGNVVLSLKDAAIVRPDLFQAKRAGTSGAIRADFAAASSRLTLSDLQVDLPQLRARGRLELDLAAPHLVVVSLSELVIAGSRLSVDLSRRSDGLYTGKVTGGRFDLTPWVLSERSSAAGMPALDLGIDIAELVLGNGQFRSLRGRLRRDSTSWQDIELDAELASEERLELRLRPGPEGRQLSIRASDAGGVMEAIDPTADFARGGSFALNAVLEAESPVFRLAGSIEAKDFRITQAPFLARLFSLATISGLAGQLGGTGIAIDQARVELALTGNKVELVKGRMSGSGIGLTMRGKVDLGLASLDVTGTLVPLYGLNRLLGQIPIVGWILRGEDGLGAFAATYSAKGPLREPEIWVNPLAFVVPGMLRDLVDVLPVSPTPPEPPATRD